MRLISRCILVRFKRNATKTGGNFQRKNRKRNERMLAGASNQSDSFIENQKLIMSISLQNFVPLYFSIMKWKSIVGLWKFETEFSTKTISSAWIYFCYVSKAAFSFKRAMWFSVVYESFGWLHSSVAFMCKYRKCILYFFPLCVSPFDVHVDPVYYSRVYVRFGGDKFVMWTHRHFVSAVALPCTLQDDIGGESLFFFCSLFLKQGA